VQPLIRCEKEDLHVCTLNQSSDFESMLRVIVDSVWSKSHPPLNLCSRRLVSVPQRWYKYMLFNEISVLYPQAFNISPRARSFRVFRATDWFKRPETGHFVSFLCQSDRGIYNDDKVVIIQKSATKGLRELDSRAFRNFRRIICHLKVLLFHMCR
jgi:hypothetical protein